MDIITKLEKFGVKMQLVQSFLSLRNLMTLSRLKGS